MRSVFLCQQTSIELPALVFCSDLNCLLPMFLGTAGFAELPFGWSTEFDDTVGIYFSDNIHQVRSTRVTCPHNLAGYYRGYGDAKIFPNGARGPGSGDARRYLFIGTALVENPRIECRQGLEENISCGFRLGLVL